ncbi:hypothetical protein FLB_02440 [Flavobacterium succinicans]|uniref:Uncharacterized protein n=1 Tax=Flavobacterium succinicans TaxID=29536 RepID=A0A199XUN3_9FLAO|nr:hypothetical protein FLB_02440 [Flavobacterium succinicans]
MLHLRNRISKNDLISVLILFSTFLFFYLLRIDFNSSTALFNDKLIDCCAIFFGVFFACLGLFEKFKTRKSYFKFIFFVKRLIYLNLLMIILSLSIIILKDINFLHKGSEVFDAIHDFFPVNYHRVLFSFYISLYVISIQQIIYFIRVILTLISEIDINIQQNNL